MPILTNTTLYKSAGIYGAANTYASGDVVTYNGSSYVLTATSSTGNLPTNTAYWTPLASAGSGVAAGGATGQVLMKASSQDYDTLWSAAPSSSGVLPYTVGSPTSAGLYYSNSLTCRGSSSSWTPPTVGWTYYLPFVTSKSMVVKQFVGNVVTGNASNTSSAYGICNSTAAGLPGTLLVSGTVSSALTTNGATFSTPLSAGTVVPAGLCYYAVINVGGAVAYSATTFAKNLTGLETTPSITATYNMYAYTTAGTTLQSDPPSVTAIASGTYPVLWYFATS